MLLASAQVGFGQNTPPPLGLASSFALFTAVGAIDNNGPSVINGDIGTNAGAFNGFPPGVINGAIHVADTRSTQAATAVQGAYGHMSAIVYNSVAVFGGTPAVTMTPGAYSVGGASTLAGTLILDGGNDSNAKFYLQVTGALTTAQNSQVLLTRGASASNVYWQIGGLTTLGQNSVMQGTLLVDGGIIMIAGAQLTGRGLSREGAITLTSATATLPGVVAAPAAGSTTWLGSRTTDWFSATNWSAGVPSSTVDAIVPSFTSPYPAIANGNASSLGLTIGNGASLNLGGGTLALNGNLNNNGTISATAGTVTLNGTNSQIFGGSGSTQLWNLTVANANGALQSSPLRIRGVLAPASGNLTTNGQPLTLLSDAAGTALVDNSGTGAVNGNATVQRAITSSNTGLGYRHYSAPVLGSTVADLTTATFRPEVSQAAVYNSSPTPATTTPFPTVFSYDQSRLATVTNNFTAFDKGFVVPAGFASPLLVGRGYVVNLSAAELVDFVGPLTTGDRTLSLARNSSASANAADAGWQLLGNPYPAPLDYSLVAPADRANLDAAIYVYASAGQYTGTYRSYANGIGNPVLPVTQGFFARVSDGQTSGTLTFRNSQRLTVPNSTPFQRTTTDTRPLVQLDLRGAAGTADALYAYAQAGATATFDAQFDALKLPNTTGLNLASVAASGEALAIDGRAAFTSSTVWPLTVGVPAAGVYTLTAAAINNMPVGLDAVLTDALTGQVVNLRLQPAYSFTVTAAQAATTLTSRFVLAFVSRTALASASALAAASVALYPNPARGVFTVLVPGATQLHAELLNTLGQVVRRQVAAGSSMTVDATSLAAGVYTLRLQVGATTVAKRVVIQ